MAVHLVDQQQVAAADVEEFRVLVRVQGVPLMERAGATFVSCDAGPDLGDDVDVLTVWSFADFVEWNRIRRNLMFDPRYFPYAAELARLRHRGTRRFYAGPGVAGPGPDDHGPALRRWEMFSLAPDAPAAARERLRRAMRDCDRFIPGITRCAVGTNTAGGPIELVWETTYESVGAYRTTYMTHPYHAALLDRFLLPDCPERITTANDFGAGLVGYAVDRDRPLGPVAVRRLLLLAFDDDDAARRAAAAIEALDDGWSDSILAENTMSTRWFDGETDLGGTPEWTHLWDQCFAAREQYEAHRRGESDAARLEAGLTARSAEVVYVPEELHQG
jgi:Stress responsive A/B Barrel Domain